MVLANYVDPVVMDVLNIKTASHITLDGWLADLRMSQNTTYLRETVIIIKKPKVSQDTRIDWDSL